MYELSYDTLDEGTNTGTAEISKIYAAVGWDPETRAYKENYEAKPIEWVKIHNLPDFVYFNHCTTRYCR